MSSCRGNTHDWTRLGGEPLDESCAKCGKLRCSALTEHKTRCRRSAITGVSTCRTHDGIEEWAKAQRKVSSGQ